MKRATTIIVITISILLVGLYTVTSTYSVIIDVIEKDGVKEIVNEITIKDLLTNNDNTYNNIYYTLKEELAVNDEEANLLINSKSINESLQIVLNTIVEYKLNNNIDAKLTDEELYNLISESIIKDNNLSDDLKSRIINKASKYRRDISDYIYNIEVSNLGANI